jgi:hypothetical protein
MRAEVLSRSDTRGLDSLIGRLENEIDYNVRRAERRAIWDAAGRYRRSRSWLEDLLPPDLLTSALHDGASSTMTWQVLRHLCRHIRFNARSGLGSPLRLRRCRIMAAGEILLLAHQRAAGRDRQFVGEVLRGISKAS